MTGKKLVSTLPFLAGLLCGLYFISLQVTGASFTFFPGDYIDGRFNNYLLEHCYRFFTGKESMFWNAPYMFPEENVITYSDNLLGSAPFYSLFRLFGADRETAFQLWYLLVTVLNYSCCYLLLHYVFKNKYASVCGAMIFAFSMALHSQMGHAQTFPRYAIPLAIWMLLRFTEDLKPVYFFWAVLFLAYQMYCGIYLGFLLTIPFLIFMVAAVFTKWDLVKQQLKQRRWMFKIIGAGLINVLLLLPLLIPYFQRALLTGFYPFENVLPSIPTIGSYFFSWKGSLCWDSLSETCISYPAFWDHEIFAGGIATFGFFIVLLVFVAGLLSQKIRAVINMPVNARLIILTAGLTFIVFLRVNDFSLYRFIYAVPGFGSMRALQRIINVELVFFAVAVAYLVNLITRKNNIVSAISCGILIAAIIADNFVGPGFIHQKVKAESQQRIQELYVKMEGIPKDKVVSYEPDTMTSSPMDYQLDAMLAAQLQGIVTLNGYSATSPGGYGPYWVKPNEEGRKIWLDRKGKTGTSVVVIH